MRCGCVTVMKGGGTFERDLCCVRSLWSVFGAMLENNETLEEYGTVCQASCPAILACCTFSVAVSIAIQFRFIVRLLCVSKCDGGLPHMFIYSLQF